MHASTKISLKQTRCGLAVGLLLSLAACGTAVKPMSSPVYSNPDQPSTLPELTWSLLSSEEDLAERLGPVKPREGEVVPEPPLIKVYSLADLEKAQIDPLLGQLVRDLELARHNDPVYQGALFEFQAAMIGADLARFAYTPSVSVANRFLENESASRTTIAISQPIFNLELLATMEEEDSRRAVAQAQMKLREYELIDRVFSAVTGLIKAQEKLLVNRSRVSALESAAMAAKREQELGKGTITDVRDAEVRFEQARAETVRLESALASAVRTLSQLVGKQVSPEAYALRKAPPVLPMDPLNSYLAGAMSSNGGLIVARANQRLAELAALKSKAANIPAVSFTASQSYSTRGDVSNSGINFGVSVPINAGTFYQAQIASAKISQSQLNTSQVKQKLEVDVNQNYADVLAGINEVTIRLKAIEAAELGLLATEKSYAGGVRTRLDVLNSVQTLYTTNEQYINSVIDLTKSYLSLSNLSSRPVSATINTLQTLLF